MERWEQSDVFQRLWRPDVWAVSEDSIKHNLRVKVYPDGSATVMCSDRTIFREAGFELSGEAPREAGAKPERGEGQEAAGEGTDGGPSADNVARARRRARSAVSDLARCTGFTHFVTLTLSPEHIDRYDMRAVMKKLNTWLDNRVRRNGLAYVLVPEYHRDGAIHFHGLFNGVLEYQDSGTISMGSGAPRRPRSLAQRKKWLENGGHVVYNVPAWKFGFSTAIELYGDRRAAVGYVCKYIGKSSEKIGGRWYLSGGNLRRPRVLCGDADYQEAAALAGPDGCFSIGELGASMACIDVNDLEVLADVLSVMARPG